MDLVIMAAGMGSRFGGLKQVEPINENGEFILDYSVYDAIRAGFDRVIFIIKQENYDLFRNTVGKRIESKIKVEYVFQDMNNRPNVVDIPKERVKPLGTGHAIYCLNGIVSEKFAVINADDFYGKDGFRAVYDFLNNSANKNSYGSVNYRVVDTLAEYGAVKRGVCIVENGKIKEIIESEVDNINGKIMAKPLSGAKEFEISEDNPVSMNLLGLHSSLFEYLNPRFEKFLLDNKDNLEKCEYLLPEVLGEMMKNEMISLASIKTSAKWKGVTYKQDKDELVAFIKNETRKGEYPVSLWK